MTSDGTLSIHVNGEHRRVRAGLSVADLASELGFQPNSVRVERNLADVPCSILSEVPVEDGDELEIVAIVSGAG